MQDKNILITGGNAGIGKATAIELARQGAKVTVLARCKMRGPKAVREIQKKSSNGDISFLYCDLSSLQSIREATNRYLQEHQKLDVLINNAGIFASKFRRTKDGFESQFGINHLAHFLLSTKLLPLLQNSDSARVVNVSSAAHFHGDIDFDSFKGDQQNYDGLKAYAQSKLANVCFTKQFAKKYPTIDCNCLHPGVVRTQIGSKNSKWHHSLIWQCWKPFMCSPENGAKTSVYLATSSEVQGISGQYFDDKQNPKTPSKKAQSQILCHRLWKVSEELVKTI